MTGDDLANGVAEAAWLKFILTILGTFAVGILLGALLCI